MNLYAQTPPVHAHKPLFAEYALPRPTHGISLVDSLAALLPRTQGKKRLVVLNELTQGYLWQRLDLAKKYQAEAFSLAEQLGDSAEYAEALMSAARIQRFASAGDAGFQMYQNALALCQRIGYQHGIATAMCNLGIVFSRQGEMLQSRIYLLQALHLADSLGDVFIAARVNSALAANYAEDDNVAKATEFYLHTLALYRCARPSVYRDFSVLIALNNLGEVYQNSRQYSSALQYYKQGHELILSHGWSIWHRMGNSCGNLSKIFRLMGRYDEAILWGKRAVFEEYQTMEHTRNTLLGRGAFPGSILRKLAEAYRDAGKTDSALIFYNKIFDFSGSDDLEIVEINSAIVAVHRERGEVRQALVYARRARDIAEKLQILKAQVLAAKTMADAFSAAKQFDTAFVYSSRYAILNDSLRNIDKAKQAERLQARFDVTVKQKENDLLKRENEMKELVISRQSTIFFGVAVFFVITVVLVVVLVRGNSRRKRDNARLAELNDKLFDANEELSLLTSEKDEILNIVTHGLKSQIFGVRSLADSMVTALDSERIAKTSAPLAEMSRSISRSATQMFSLVTNLLAVSTAEQGFLKPILAATDVAALLRGVCEQFKEFAAVKGITLNLDVPESGLPQAQADAQMLHEVLENLISNAVKYSPHGKNVFIRLKSSAGAVCVEVTDEGEGISSDDQKKLFGKFARLSAQPTGGEHSTGLGLSIVKKLVEAMNGRVWCESELGKGATFVVELPAVSTLAADNNL
jgi:signal transduction histidine kinase